MVDAGEECDDGNDMPGDGCENNCTETVISPTCGDGMVNGDDECDDGNTDNTDACTNTCKNAKCGDGIVQAGVDQCDDGGPSAACDSDCTLSECGDGVINEAADEECDDGNADPTDTCTSTCKAATCGDMIVQAGIEECDDGSPDGDDLCNQCKNVPYRYIFTTAQTYTGDFDNVSFADVQCALAAQTAQVPASQEAAWVAWLSANASQAAMRLDTNFTGWYVLPTEPPTLVARGWSGLTSGSLLQAIDTTEAGDPLPAPATVWTNTDVTGMLPASNLHCKNWNFALMTGLGRVGLSTALNGDWTDPSDPSSATCDTKHHLYCIEDVL